MPQIAPKRRLSSANRREAILQAAAFVFAERGYAGTTTQAIASRANISEALMYQHFASKDALYQAVLGMLLEQQDERLSRVPTGIASTGALVALIRNYLKDCIALRADHPDAMSQRLMIASLASDGEYARRIYRRALRVRRAIVADSLEKAGLGNDISGHSLNPTNAFFFVENIGSMLSLSQLQPRRSIPYAGADKKLLKDALLFCLRGLGLPESYALEKAGEETALRKDVK